MKRIIAAMLVLTALLALGGCTERKTTSEPENYGSIPVTYTEG